MIKNNKVINKVLLPKALSLCFLVAFSSGASIYVANNNVQQNNIIIKSKALLLSLVTLLIVFSFADVYSDYKKQNAFLKLVARKYLKQELKNHSELKMFENVLDNPHAMKNVSAVVFNSLRSSEVKRAAQIVANMNHLLRNHKKYGLNETEFVKNTKAIISDARNQIIPIIEGHASVHTEFFDEIYSAMASANNTMYMMSKKTIQQHTK